jgi:tight adherence protein B
MVLILILSFLGAFAVIALPLMAAGGSSAKGQKRVMTALDDALGRARRGDGEAITDLRKGEQFSSIPWLNRKLLSLHLMQRLQNVLDQADVKWTAGKMLAASGLCALLPGYLVQLKYGHYWEALLVGSVTGILPLGWVYRKRTKRLDLFIKELPEGLDLMVSGLRAGHSLISAIGLVADECPDPLGQEFKGCFEEQNYGLELKMAFENLVRRVPVQDLKIVTSAIMIQKESGGNLAELLEKTSETIRQRFRLKRQIQVHTAQGRMTGLVLGCLPIMLGVLLYFLNPNLMSVLWKTTAGLKLMGVSGGLTLLGGLAIRHIVNIDV